MIRMGLTADFGDSGDTGRFRVGMIEEDAVSYLHLIAHEVACLIVAYAVPSLRYLAGEIVDAEDLRFALH